MGIESENEKVTIEGYAFYGCKNLEEITFGPCVSVIEGKAFSSCENLKIINLSSGLTKIGDSAFEYCRKLEQLNFDGTPEEWLSIDFWPWWNRETGDYEENILK